MKANINEIIDYYATADVSFCDVFTSVVEPNSSASNMGTNPFHSGLILPMAGSACFTLDGTPYVMEPGTIVHARSNMRLDKYTIGEDPWRYAVIHYKLPESTMAQFPFYQAHFSFQAGNDAVIPDMIHKISLNQESLDPFARFTSKMLFIDLLSKLFDSAKAQIADSNSVLVKQIMEYLRQKSGEAITVSSTAKYFGLDRRRLAALFDKHVGMTPTNYLIECRIVKAKELLRTCSCSVKQVSECVGYADSLYFSKAFKKRMGVSPSDYQERMRRIL